LEEKNLSLKPDLQDTEIPPTPLPPAPARFGNEEINEVMEMVKSYNGGIVNGSDSKQRKYANHLLKKLKKLDSVQNEKFSRQSVLEMILRIISDNEYHATKISSPELIYRNLASLMTVCRQEFKKQSKPSGVF
jgi:hypothetical protein